jgi:hypothetical protein
MSPQVQYFNCFVSFSWVCGHYFAIEVVWIRSQRDTSFRYQFRTQLPNLATYLANLATRLQVLYLAITHTI